MQKSIVSGTIVAGVAVLAYLTSMPGTFHYDDVPTILQNPAVTEVSSLPRYFVDPSLFSGVQGNAMYRPVLLSTYLLDYLLGGFSPFVWHLTNVLLHALNAFLVVLLTALLLRIFRERIPIGPTSLVSGLAFALHPVHTEVVNYISSRSGAIATAGFLVCLLLHIAWTRGERRPLTRGLLLAASLLAFGAGLGGKEIAVALVPCVALLEILDPEAGPLRRRLLRSAVRTAPYLALAIGYLLLRKWLLSENLAGLGERMFTVKGKEDLYWGGGRTVVQNLLTQARVFWMYLGLLVVPVDLAVDRFVRVSTSIGEASVLSALAGIAVVAGLLVGVARRRPLVTFCGAVFVFGLAPTSSIIPLNVVMNEHRLYLPGVGVAILSALLFAALVKRRPRAGVAIAVAVSLCYLGVVVPRNLAWQDPWKLWADNVRTSPRSFRGHNQLGSAYLTKAERLGDVPEALPLLEKAIASLLEAERLYENWYHAHLNLGIAYRRRGSILKDDGDFEESLRQFGICLRLAENGWRARYQIASTYGVWKKYDEALTRFEEMADEDRSEPGGDRLPIYLFPMAKLNRERGRLDLAEELYREILVHTPDDLQAHIGLASVLDAAGRPRDGAEVFTDLLSRRGDDPKAHLAFAEFLIGLDPPERRGAAAHFQRAIQLGYPPTPEEFDRFFSD